jgi:hypothetical protein
MSDFIIKYWLNALFGLAVAVLGTVCIRLKSRLSMYEVMKQAILALLHDRLYEACKFNIQRGWASIEDKRNLEYMFVPYSKMGGNGTCKIMYERCQELPYEPANYVAGATHG